MTEGQQHPPIKTVFSDRDMKSAWKAGRKYERLYGCVGSEDKPTFLTWFNETYIREK
jgi:hypothetical protein